MLSSYRKQSIDLRQIYFKKSCGGSSVNIPRLLSILDTNQFTGFYITKKNVINELKLPNIMRTGIQKK